MNGKLYSKNCSKNCQKRSYYAPSLCDQQCLSSVAVWVQKLAETAAKDATLKAQKARLAEERKRPSPGQKNLDGYVVSPKTRASGRKSQPSQVCACH